MRHGDAEARREEKEASGPSRDQVEYPLWELTDKIIAAAIEVHRELGPGYLEKIYENARVLELQARGHRIESQLKAPVHYKGRPVGRHQLDLLVDGEVVVELKSVEALVPVHKAQLRSTLKAAGKKIGLLINFNHETLAQGIRRVVG